MEHHFVRWSWNSQDFRSLFCNFFERAKDSCVFLYDQNKAKVYKEGHFDLQLVTASMVAKKNDSKSSYGVGMTQDDMMRQDQVGVRQQQGRLQT